MKWFKKTKEETSLPTDALYAATVLAASRLLSRLRSAPTEASFLERECHRAQELGQSLTLLQLELADWAGVVAAIGSESAARTQTELGLVLRGTLRATDILNLEETGIFTVFLPGTLATDLPTITRNLYQAIRGYRLLSADGAPVSLQLHPWIVSASLPTEGLTASELMSLLQTRLADARTRPPALLAEDDHGRPLLRLTA